MIRVPTFPPESSDNKVIAGVGRWRRRSPRTSPHCPSTADVPSWLSLQKHNLSYVISVKMSQLHHVVLARVVEVPTSVLAVAIASIVVIGVYAQFFYDSRRRHLPPGPRGWPIFGNSFQISFEKDPAPQLAKWTKEFGEIFYLSIGGSDFVDRKSVV